MTSPGLLAATFIYLSAVILTPLGASSQANRETSGRIALSSRSVRTPDGLNSYAQRLFERYTANRRYPLWESWKDQCDLHLLVSCKPLDANSRISLFIQHGIHSLSIPPQVALFLQDKEEIASASGAKVITPAVLQSIYYNPAAERQISLHGWSKQATLDKRLKSLESANAPLASLDITDFPKDAVIVKTIWERVNVISGRPNTLRIYNNVVQPLNPKSIQAKLTPLNNWPQITIDDSPGAVSQCKYNAAKTQYTLGCFYYREITNEDVDDLPPDVVASPDFINGPCEATKCYFVLVGVHIMTRATPRWVWMTYWWSNDNSGVVTSKREFFLSKATSNNEDRVANPYLEGITKGMNTNCMQCHRLALYSPYHDTSFGQEQGSIAASAFGSVPSDLLVPRCYFQGGLQTHFLWTIAMNQDESPKAAAPANQPPCLWPPESNAAAIKH